MIIFPEPPPLPPAPDVMRWTRDGRALAPQVEYERRLTEWLKRLATFAGTPPLGSVGPTTATIAAAGAIGRLVATLTSTAGVQPITYTIAANPAGMGLKITGNQLLSTTNPIGAVGAHAINVTATDGLGAALTITLTVTLT